MFGRKQTPERKKEDDVMINGRTKMEQTTPLVSESHQKHLYIWCYRYVGAGRRIHLNMNINIRHDAALYSLNPTFISQKCRECQQIHNKAE